MNSCHSAGSSVMRTWMTSEAERLMLCSFKTRGLFALQCGLPMHWSSCWHIWGKLVKLHTHKDVCPIICKALVNDSSCEAGMHHFQADFSLTSRSRVLLIQIYLWQDTLWACIKRMRTPRGHSQSCAKRKGTHEQKEGIFCCQMTQFQVIYAYNTSPGG